MNSDRHFNPKQFGKVAVIMGGDNDEREISLMSGNDVLQALRKRDIDAHPFDPSEQDIFSLKQQGFDRAMIMVHGTGGDDGQLQAICEHIGIPYSGSGVLACALTWHKLHCKTFLRAHGLPVLPDIVITDDTTLDDVIKKVGDTFVIKPARAGSSQGITLVRDTSLFADAVNEARRYDSLVFAEPLIEGDELTVTVLFDEAYPPIQIVPKVNFYDYKAKYFCDSTQYLCPPTLSDERIDELQAIGLGAYRAVDAKDWARVDLLKDDQDQFWIMELNMVPGMTSHSLVPKSAKVAGLSMSDLCVELLASTLQTQ